jgi:glycosyltransferase involved in cell wall biosynthesis
VAGALEKRVGSKPVFVLPDIADASEPNHEYELARRVRSFAKGRRVIGLIGSLERRKGVLTLLRAACQLESEPLLFVFAGTLADNTFAPGERDEIERAVRSNPTNCIFHFGWIPGEAEFNALIALCDVVFAGYEGFYHSSNIIGKAALFRKPVIVSKGYFMDEVVTRYRLGLVIEEGSIADCMDATRKLAYGTGGDAANNYAAYLSDNSAERFERRFMKAIAAR